MSEVSTSSTTLYDMLIGQYRLDSHYTQTAVSDIYLARDINTRQSVALEVLHPSLSKSYCNRYVKKVETVANLHHPNIAPIYNIGYINETRPYVAREFIEGYQFSARLKQLEEQTTPRNSIYALKMVRELADALALAESEQIFHHYLSPERLVLKYDGTLVLVDLGVPDLPNGHNTHRSSAFAGSNTHNEYYLSPEQRNGKEINGRSHVYTLGIILHQLLTGLPPTPPPTRWQKFRGNYPNLRQLRPDLSPHLHELVSKCLQRDAWRRYQNLAELTAVIDATLEAETLFIQTGTALPTIATTKERRPWVYLFIPLFIVLSFFIMGYAAIQTLDITNTPLTQQFDAYLVDDLSSEEAVTNNITPSSDTTTETSAPIDETIPNNLPNAPIENTIQIVEPLQDEKIKIGSTVAFTWTWPITLETHQTFTVYVADENGEKLVGQVKQANNEGVYELVVNSATFATDNGIYLWRVVLFDEAANEEILISSTTPLRIVQDSTSTPTATASTAPSQSVPPPTRRPTQTPQPSATNTQTPRPTNTAPIIQPTEVPFTATPLPTTIPPTTIPPTAPPTAPPPTSPPTSPPPTSVPPTAIPPTSPPATATIPPPPPPPATVPPPP